MLLYFEIWKNGYWSPEYANVKLGLVEATKLDYGHFVVSEIGDDYVVIDGNTGESGASYGTFGTANPLESNGHQKKVLHIGESVNYYNSWSYNGNTHTNSCTLYLRRVEPIQKPIWSRLLIDTPEGEHIEYTRKQVEAGEMKRLYYEWLNVEDDSLSFCWEEDDDEREGPWTITCRERILLGREPEEWSGCMVQLVSCGDFKMYQFNPETEKMEEIK